ncbi:MAG TPA: 3-ketoacyl-ACP reductase [Alphaproteobacteria bacterium]
MQESKRRAALVTGGRRGIAYALAEAGFDVAIIDLEQDAACDETLAALRDRGARTHFIRGDIAGLDRHAAMIDEIYAAFGTLDCLVSNAGVQVKVRGDILDVKPESYDRVMGVNLRGTFFLTQQVARRMVAEERPADSPARSIITISSANAFIAGPDHSEYCMSKTALSMMTKMLAVRLAPHRIYTYEIRPGIIQTDMTAVAREKYDR